jgi:hypothetical protein
MATPFYNPDRYILCQAGECYCNRFDAPCNNFFLTAETMIENPVSGQGTICQSILKFFRSHHQKDVFLQILNEAWKQNKYFINTKISFQ